MSLSVALNTARSAIQSTTTQIATSGKNVAGADDPNYSRKVARTVTTDDGGARIAYVTRSNNSTLYTRMLNATSSQTAQSAVLDGLDRLATTVGDPESDLSPAAKIGQLSSALVEFANAPDDPLFGRNVVTSANDLATTLNDASALVDTIRTEADQDIGSSVARINKILADFEVVNEKIVSQSRNSADMTDLLDKRDALISSLSEEMGITVVNREKNDVVLYTDSGVTLFETHPRTVTFNQSTVLSPGVPGNAVLVDGVPVTGAGATMPLQSGRLVGLTQLRDDISNTFQRQLDETARGLITAFAETDQVGPPFDPDQPGLFTYTDTPTPGIPAGPPATPGLAGLLKVNPAADPNQGGSTARIRDGINGGDYTYNTTGAASYSARVSALVDGLDASQGFDPTTGLSSTSSVTEFAAESTSWIEGLRATTSRGVDQSTAILARSSEALSNATGVNLDEEYAMQLQFEQSYAASAKLIGLIDELYKTLLTIVR
ncbi:flagellar hook-associated protein FlgK [Amorphus orientalis]|uniref:Flagellar hook-associated protein 1 n=1 Tax=Amorphus orientalis TaxID=649198 RepID=A0AAE4AUL5_9HYPH|nr:flagellar hook-associated protein FlgK [Amorphus orientalis]MDQ0317578.1 flagellar hook-associated protein 1 FlgK [Amorphus orientalis]